MKKITQKNRVNIYVMFMSLILMMLFSASLFAEGLPVNPINGSIPCNSANPIPMVSGTFDSLTTSSGTTGLCVLGCGIMDVPELIDANLNNAATVFTTVGVGVTHRLRVTDGNDTYPVGTFAGYRIDPNGGLSVNLLSNISIKTYLGGTLRETTTGSSLATINLLANPGNYVVGFNAKQSFDAIEITINSLVGAITSTNIYYPVITTYCAGPALDCNVPTAMNYPLFPTTIETSHTGIDGVLCLSCSVTDTDNLIDAATTNYALISLTAAVAARGSIAVKDQVTDYPAGTYAGFEIENTQLVGVSALGNITVTTYLNGAFKQQFSGNNLLVNGNLLNSAGRYKIGFVSTMDFDEIQISINQVVGVNLGITKVYNAIFEKFCAGPALSCNTPTVMTAPTYPVFINGVYTGINGSVCLLCSVTNTENLIDTNASNYATISLTAAIGINGSIAVKDQITDYPAGTFAGFDIESPGLLNVNALDAVTITTYLNGTPKEIKSGIGALVAVGTDLLVTTGRKTIGFTATLPFDEVRITLNNTLTVSLGDTKVYSALMQKFCAPTVLCNKTYALTNPDFPVTIDSDKSGINGVACVACAVNNSNNVLTANTTDFANITLVAGVLATGSIAVKDQLFTYPSGTFSGFTIKDLNNLLELDLFQSLTISTYNNGVLQHAKTGAQLIGLSLVTPILGSGPGFYNVGFKATSPFDEIRITVASLASVITNVNVYGAFVNTKDSNSDPAGSLNCASSNLSIVKTASNNTPAVGSNITFTIIAANAGPSDATAVLVNDILPTGYTYLNSTVTVGTYDKTTGVWIVGDIATNANETLTITAIVNATGNYSNTATITGNQPDPDTTDNTSTSTPTPVNVILANDDSGTLVNGFSGGTVFTNVLANDTLNGQPVVASQVNTTFVSATNVGISLSGTAVVVAAGTPAGTYTLTYQICEILNPTNCDQAIVTVNITAAPIVANDDTGTPVNGFTGGTAFTNVLTNDTLNGQPVVTSQVSTTLVSATNAGLTLSGTNVVVAAGTPAGTYTLTYQICEILNPTNCDQAIVTVNVTAAPLVANDDTATPVNGFNGGTVFTNVLANDTLNAQPVVASQVNTTFVSATNTGLTLSGTDVVVAAGTPAGTYTLTYQICEILNPTNCDQAVVTITVTAAPIVANDDTGTPVNGFTGATVFTNVLANDTLNGLPVVASQVNTTFVSATNAGITLSGTDVLVAAGTSAGTYTLTYHICEILNPTNCDQAIVTVTVNMAPIVANDDTATTINGTTGGTAFTNVLANDTLNGLPVVASQVNTTFVSATNAGITLSGTDVVVAPGTPAATYTLTYQICEILNPTNCDQATVSVNVNAATILANDDIGTPVNGFNGATVFTNVLLNDTLNGQPVVPNEVNTSFVSATNAGITLSGTDVIVAPGTPAGKHSLMYQICDLLNSSNCDTATVSVIVTAAPITANDDTGTPVNGFVGGTVFTNVLVNDTLNGQPVVASQVNTTFVSSSNTAITLSGTNVVVNPGSPAGNYSLTYQICEKLNPTNCDQAIVRVNVTAAPIVANDDNTGNINGYTGGTFTNVLANDTLNGQPVVASQLNTTFVSATNAGISLSGTDIVVAAGTPAGIYTLTYQICENINPANCDQAIVTINVTEAPIVANDDNTGNINGYTGGTFSNVLANDTLNGQPVVASQVNTTLVSATNAGITLSGTDIVIAAGTPAGAYTLTYKICEILNPTNCDQAIVTINVTAAPIVANDDNTGNINGYTGGTFSNVLANDTLNGQPVVASQVNTTLVSATNAGITLSGIDIVVAAATPAGTYTLTYKICEILNPTNCDQAVVTITVNMAPIVASDDNTGNINGYTGGTFSNVLANDTLNGQPVVVSQVNTTLVSATNAGITLSGTDVVVGAGTPAGTYTLTYQICEILNPTNCDQAIVTVNVTAAPIVANDDTGTPVNDFNGGTVFTNVLVNDTLNGQPVVASQVNTTFVSATNAGITLSGTNVIVAPGTPAGTYTLIYQICEILNPANCDTATVFITVNVAPNPGISITKDGTYVDNNGNGITDLGDTITYKFVITNTGNVPLTDITVTDDNAAVTGGPLANLVAGETDATTFTAIHTITQADIDNTWVYNLATVTAYDPANNPITATSTDPTPCQLCPTPFSCLGCTITPLAATPSITITKDSTYIDNNANGITDLGDTITYKFVITNTGNVTLTDITVTDNNAAVTGGPLASLEVGASDASTFTASHTITQDDINSGLVYNLATVTAQDPANNPITEISTDPTPCTTCPIDPACTTCTITILTQSPGISITKDGTYVDNNGNGITDLGDTITYKFVITNTGNVTLTNITVTDDNAAVTGGPLASLEVGASDATTFTASHTITQADINNGLVYNLATVTAQDPANNPIIGTSTDPTPCTTCPIDPDCTSCSITVLIVAKDDTFNDVACNNSNTVLGNILSNDSVGINVVNSTSDSHVTLSILTGSYPNISIDNSGNINVSNGIQPGSYPFTYKICSDAMPGLCDQATVTINIIDTTNPVWTSALPQDTIVSCSDVPAVPALTGSDTCSNVIIDYNEQIIAGSCSGSYTITRTWTLKDNANNSIIHTQNINVQDNTTPVFVEALPADENISCLNAPAPAVILTATDNCGTATVIFNEVMTQGLCAGSYILTRTWTASDACNNKSTAIQTITVQDNEAPAFVEAQPANLTVDCSAIPVAPTLNATDNCGSATITFTEVNSDIDSNGTYNITRTWTATDLCNNSNVYSQSIEVTVPFQKSTLQPLCNGDVGLSINVLDLFSTQFPDVKTSTGTWIDVTAVPGVFDMTTGIFTPYNLEIGNYVIRYKYNEDPICTEIYEIIIPINDDCKVLPCDTLIIHNVVTRNNDGKNEYFDIENITNECYTDNSVEIFNRWGVKVFEITDYDNETRVFNGLSDGRSTIDKSVELPDGTYFYVLKYKNSTSSDETVRGYIYLSK